MSNIQNSVRNLYALERLAGGSTVIHRLHPAAKLCSALVFIVTVASFDRYALGDVMPYVFYPAVMMALSETPRSMLLRRFLAALPFCLFAGVTNIIFDRAPAFHIGSMAVSYGVLSFAALLLRAYLCVTAVLILIATTPFSEISAQLRRMRVPAMLVLIFEMTYRYIGVLLGEAGSMYTAYSLRSASKNGLEMRHMGSFVGQLLIRSFDRAERVYAAMKCRGYELRETPPAARGFRARDVVAVAAVSAMCALFRALPVSVITNALLGGFG
ncbi:MAG: cobalt ECF transporter T component CbiQ [Oscillospiraceae bacterium]|jgi:cobalt/nickel transport system permease protein|nr:cobalt ECF transporter T component CbiQ [Oscillospiraceae bacterium]